MLFNSLSYCLFFIAVVPFALSGTRRWQNVVLLGASYLFYSFWDWRFAGLLLLSSLVDFGAGLALDNARGKSRRRYLAISLIVNLGVLATFKYLNFFIDTLAPWLTKLGLQPDALTLHVILPVGISFYTFQSMSYTIDVYMRRTPTCRSLLDFLLYVSFFPQLVAGPIERASALLIQLQKRRQFKLDNFKKGGWLLLLGYYKKVVLADNLAPIADRVFENPDHATFGTLVVGTLAFTGQIYGDFSGYSSIARGSAMCLGINLSQNFRLPYFATNPSDFWRRWHISLSEWFRDYVYIPLGGSRGSRARSLTNLLVTMMLAGLWHGAAWNFVLWGLYHGVVLVIFHVLFRTAESLTAPTLTVRFAGAAAMFVLTCIGWLLFRVDSVGTLLYFAHLPLATIELRTIPWQLLALPLVLLPLALAQERTQDEFWVKDEPRVTRLIIYSLLVMAICLFGVSDGNEFIYFQF